MLWFLILFVAAAHAQYGTFRSDVYSYETPSADAAWKAWLDKLRELEDKLSTRCAQESSVLKQRIEQLELQVANVLKASTYDWKRADSGSLYKVFTMKKSFDEAQAICKTFNSHLAVIDSEHKNKYVKDMLSKTTDSHQDSWIGLKTKASMGAGFANFAGDQPVEGCASIDHKGKWLIKGCDQTKPFICQQITVR